MALRVGLADRGGQQRIEAQLVVVVEVLVTQRESQDPLRDEVADRVFDPRRVPVVVEAAGELLDDLGAFFNRLQQEACGLATGLLTS